MAGDAVQKSLVLGEATDELTIECKWTPGLAQLARIQAEASK